MGKAFFLSVDPVGVVIGGVFLLVIFFFLFQEVWNGTPEGNDDSK